MLDTRPTPQENLDYDDALLEQEKETLRLWESPMPFVVMGASGRVEEEVHEERCLDAQIPIIKRSSGGGTVLQAPGCLNYAYVISLEKHPHLAHIEESYALILGKIIERLGIEGLTVEAYDIVNAENRKVSGNAQRRTRGWLLHHGTLLYQAMDLSAITRFLKEPPRQPAYRAGRTHEQFVARLPLERDVLVDRLGAKTI